VCAAHRPAGKRLRQPAQGQRGKRAHRRRPRRSEERLRLINDTIPILIGYVDQDEVYRYANKGYSDWYGHPEGGHRPRVLDVIGPEVYAQVGFRAQGTVGQQVTYEYQMDRQGQTVFARSTLVPNAEAKLSASSSSRTTSPNRNACRQRWSRPRKWRPSAS
jgi:PAS domain-containing protein